MVDANKILDNAVPKLFDVCVTLLYFPEGLLQEKTPIPARLMAIRYKKFRGIHNGAHQKYIHSKFEQLSVDWLQ